MLNVPLHLIAELPPAGLPPAHPFNVPYVHPRMARIQDDFVLKPGRSIPRRGVLDRSSFKWEMTPDQAPDEYRGIDEDSVQTLQYVPNEDWLFEDVAGVRAPLDYASIFRLGKIVRPLLRSDNGPIPAAGERLFVIENPKPMAPNWTVLRPPPPPPPPPRSADPATLKSGTTP